MLNILFGNPIVFLFWAIGLIVAITIHEFAHAFVADKLGDPTPRLQGRLTLNPLSHLDPLGTIMLLIARFGWGKPVQFDPYNLENPQRDAALISVAGPASNLILATILSLIVRVSPMIGPAAAAASSLLFPIIFLNVMLAIFNLIPIHPLDGGKILVFLLPDHIADEADEFMNRYGTIILILLIMPFTGISPVSALILPAIDLVINLLLP